MFHRPADPEAEGPAGLIIQITLEANRVRKVPHPC